jgi:hypothetical protein
VVTLKKQHGTAVRGGPPSLFFWKQQIREEHKLSGHAGSVFWSRIKKSQDYGAGDGTRTRGILLGKQVLYQLSYTRLNVASVSPKPHLPANREARFAQAKRRRLDNRNRRGSRGPAPGRHANLGEAKFA